MRMRFSTKFVILCVLSYSLAAKDAASPIAKLFRINNIVPEVISRAPPTLMKVYFNRTIMAEKGTTLSPFQLSNSPSVTWEAEDDDLYTLILIDADAVLDDETEAATEYLLWLVANIPINDLCNGKHFASYEAPNPARGTGYHRYVFLAYKQPRGFLFTRNPLYSSQFKGREPFSTKNFTLKFKLGDPVAGNFFRSRFFDFSETEK